MNLLENNQFQDYRLTRLNVFDAKTIHLFLALLVAGYLEKREKIGNYQKII